MDAAREKRLLEKNAETLVVNYAAEVQRQSRGCYCVEKENFVGGGGGVVGLAANDDDGDVCNVQIKYIM